MSDLKAKAGWLIGLLYVAFVAWSLYGAVVPVETYLFRMVHMAFIYALSFLVYPFSKAAKGWTRWLDVGLAILGVASILFAFVDLDQFIRRSTVPEPTDFWFGIVAIVLIVEISRRVVGMEWFADRGNLLLTLLHPFVTGEQQRLGFSVFLLPEQTGSQQAPGVEAQPVIGNLLFADGQALAGQGFGLGELPIGQQGADSLD